MTRILAPAEFLMTRTEGTKIERVLEIPPEVLSYRQFAIAARLNICM
jgi:hypothetical protein